mgnify:CR=1 FL=1
MAQIDKPNLNFNTVLYTGNASTRSITGVGFQPDWCWFKSRGDTNGHMLYDVVRGATKVVLSNSGNAEATETNGLTSFDSDGFSIGSAGGENASGQPIVAWNWKAGGSGSANTNGTINSTVSANATAGFSVVKYTGTGSNATVGHGLSSAPLAVFVKNYSNGSNYDWICYHKNAGNSGFLRLNTANAYDTSINAFNSTDPTSTVFSIGSHTAINGSSDNFIAYCFAEKKGYSQFGSYTGNASTNGPFIYTGFKPAWVLQKNYTNGSSNDWTLADNKRPGYNEINKRLVPNTNAAEATNNQIDFLSNGFKIRGSETNANGSGQTYVYLAFAENPIVGSNNVAAVAE